MKAQKRRKLEAAGWRFGSADEFLGLPGKKLPSLRPLALSHYVYGDGRTAAWLVVRDPSAGRRRAYTGYRIALGGDKRVHVIGRELDLPIARKLVRQDMEATR